MQTLTFSPIQPPARELRPAFNVVIAYEDFDAGKRAMKTYDYLVHHLGEQCHFNNQMWKFDVLAIAKLREMAARDAMAADVVIIAARGAGELPAEVRLWLESWLDDAKNLIALVGLFDLDATENRAREYLDWAARNAKVAFFSQPGSWPCTRAGSAGGELDRGSQAFSILANMVQEPPTMSHWGINE